MSDDITPPTIEGFSDFQFIQRRTYFSLWRAHQDALGRSVVIRVVNPETPREQIEHGEVVAKALAGLSHPALPQIYDIHLAVPPAYIVEEEPSGAPVSQLSSTEKPCDVKTAASIGLKVAVALEYLSQHSKLVIRNLKPENIYRDGDGNVMISDFSLAILSGDPVHGPAIDGENLVGTPQFISPEQATGAPDIDTRSDMYALGATLYFLVTGYAPFDGLDPLDILDKQLTAFIRNPRDRNPAVPPAFANLLARLMMKAPAHRPASWGDVVDAFRKFSTGRLPSLPPPPNEAVSTIAAATTPTPAAMAFEAESAAQKNEEKKTRRLRPVRITLWCLLLVWLAWLANVRLGNPVGLPGALAPDLRVAPLDNATENLRDLFAKEPPPPPEEPPPLEKVYPGQQASPPPPAAQPESRPTPEQPAPPPAEEDISWRDPVYLALKAGDFTAARKAAAASGAPAAKAAADVLSSAGKSPDDVFAAALLKRPGQSVTIHFNGKAREITPVAYNDGTLTTTFASDGTTRAVSLQLSKIAPEEKLRLLDLHAETEAEHLAAAVLALQQDNASMQRKHAASAGPFSDLLFPVGD